MARDLREPVLAFLRSADNLRHGFLEPGNGGYPRGQFYEGLYMAEREGRLPLEELLKKLRRLRDERPDSPVGITAEQLRIGVRSVLWQVHEAHASIRPAYLRFAERLREERGRAAVISFNWDLQAERMLHAAGIPWRYAVGEEGTFPVIKPHGSINWSAHRKLSMHPVGWSCTKIPGTSLAYVDADPLSNHKWDEVVPQTAHVVYPGDPDSPSVDDDMAALWKHAGQLLDRARTVVFIGYSFPRYDENAAAFFREKVCGREVVVVNPSEPHLARAMEVLRPNAARVKTRQEGFETWVGRSIDISSRRAGDLGPSRLSGARTNRRQ